MNGVLNTVAGDKLGQIVPWTASAVLDYSHDVSFLWDRARSYLRIDYRWLDRQPHVSPLDAAYNPLNFPDSAYLLLKWLSRVWRQPYQWDRVATAHRGYVGSLSLLTGADATFGFSTTH